MPKKPELKEGQTIFVESNDWLSIGLVGKREPVPYEITKINSRSIYAKTKDTGYEQRFDKKTWSSDTMFGTDYIWLSIEDYRKAVKRNEDKKALRSRIAWELSNLPLERLQSIAEMLNIKLN